MSEDYLFPAKKKGKKKEDNDVKEIPPPPTLKISEAELSGFKVGLLLVMVAFCIYLMFSLIMNMVKV